MISRQGWPSQAYISGNSHSNWDRISFLRFGEAAQDIELCAGPANLDRSLSESFAPRKAAGRGDYDGQYPQEA